jgi:hypothetical protein
MDIYQCAEAYSRIGYTIPSGYNGCLHIANSSGPSLPVIIIPVTAGTSKKTSGNSSGSVELLQELNRKIIDAKLQMKKAAFMLLKL